MRSEGYREASFVLDLDADPIENTRNAIRAELNKEARLKAQMRMYYDHYEGHIRTMKAIRTTGLGREYLGSDDPAILYDKLRRLRMVNAGLEGTRDNMLREIYSARDPRSRRAIPKERDRGEDMRSRLDELSRRRRVKRHTDVYGTGSDPKGYHPDPSDLPAWNMEYMEYLERDDDEVGGDPDQDLAGETTDDDEDIMPRRRSGAEGGSPTRAQDRVEVAADGTIVITLSDAGASDGPARVPYGSNVGRVEGVRRGSE